MTADGTSQAWPFPGKGTSLLRGLTRRCARCGSGKLFRHYLTMVPDCPRCGLHFEREQGYWAGALAINIVCVFGLMAIFLFSGVLLISPIPAVPLAIVCGTIAILGPIVWYPFSKTIWVAIDRGLLQTLDKNERLDERY
jgi:uncharacterized protein (DUF983 family)